MTTVILTDPRWYIVRTNGGQESLARSAIRAEGIEAYLPVYTRTDKEGSSRGFPFFPGYLFARLGAGIPGWTRIFSARGVHSVLGNCGRPSPLPDSVIEEIKWREAEGFIEMGLSRDERTHRPGDPVTLRIGPFTAIDAVFMEHVDTHRCKLLIRLLGNSSRIATADLAHVETASSADAIDAARVA